MKHPSNTMQCAHIAYKYSHLGSVLFHTFPYTIHHTHWALFFMKIFLERFIFFVFLFYSYIQYFFFFCFEMLNIRRCFFFNFLFLILSGKKKLYYSDYEHLKWMCAGIGMFRFFLKIYYLVFTMCLFLPCLRRHVCRPILSRCFN